jgi:hypothetical protein
MNCADIQELISGYLDDSLAQKDRRLVEAHIESCGKCRRNVNELRHTLALVHGLQEVNPPADFVEQFRRKLNDSEDEQSEPLPASGGPVSSASTTFWLNRPAIQVALAACFIGMITVYTLIRQDTPMKQTVMSDTASNGLSMNTLGKHRDEPEDTAMDADDSSMPVEEALVRQTSSYDISPDQKFLADKEEAPAAMTESIKAGRLEGAALAEERDQTVHIHPSEAISAPAAIPAPSTAPPGTSSALESYPKISLRYHTEQAVLMSTLRNEFSMPVYERGRRESKAHTSNAITENKSDELSTAILYVTPERLAELLRLVEQSGGGITLAALEWPGSDLVVTNMSEAAALAADIHSLGDQSEPVPADAALETAP